MIAERARLLIAAMRQRSQEYQSVQGEAALETLRRYRKFILFLLPMHLFFAWQFGHYQAPLGQPELVSWAGTISNAHTAMLVLDALLWLCVERHLRGRKAANRWSYALVLCTSGTYVVFGAILSLADVKVGAGAGIASFLLTTIMISVTALMRPALSWPLFLGVYLYFQQAIGTLGISLAQQASVQAISLSIPLLALLTSFTIWQQYVKTVLVQRQLSVRNAELLHLAQHDPLTGLYNRRHFAAEATAELARAHRTHSPSSILIADIDFFKKVNDQYGHPAGDQVLKEVASVLASNVRATDVVARLGGEEFIVLMPHTTRDGAMALAEKLRSSMDKHPMQVEAQTLAVTVSVGVSELAADQDGGFEDLYIAADTALYAAKSHGRNRVEWAPFRLREGSDTQI